MLLMHYDIRLPGDFDMEIIRDRVRTRGHALDHLSGLGFKAYLIREATTDAAGVNAYAPFYLWTSGQVMQDFLLGPGFAGLSNDFGRPVVEQWMAHPFHRGQGFEQQPRWATLERIPLSPDRALDRSLDLLSSQQALHLQHPELHSTCSGWDTRTWEGVLLALWTERPTSASGILFQVLHFSSPEMNML